jgi:hypothetical protein
MTTKTATVGRKEHLTFKGNLKQTRYGWLRLTPAYSVHLVAELLNRDLQIAGDVLDPFGGTGTTALVCAEKGVSSCMADINPFLVWLASIKTTNYSQEEIDSLRVAGESVSEAIEDTSETCEWFPPLHQIEKWWDPTTLHALGRGMALIKTVSVPNGASDLLQLAFCRTLIERASVSFGHQSMSFKKKKEQETLLTRKELSSLVAEAWRGAIEMIATSAQSVIVQRPQIELCDARQLQLSDGLGDRLFGRVITSPPYPNRMSYIRELRPYMYWLGYLSDGRAAGELDWQTIGGTWGCATSNVGKWAPDSPREIPHPDFLHIISRIGERSDVLSRYVHKYFFDMIDHVISLKQIVAPRGTLHYIVGNSKFFDVLLPVERIYAGMFAEAGFSDVRVETMRKRSSKRELFEYVVSARQPA